LFKDPIDSSTLGIYKWEVSSISKRISTRSVEELARKLIVVPCNVEANSFVVMPMADQLHSNPDML
jgi:hypothetical protein